MLSTREIWSVDSWERANSLEVEIIRHLYHHLSIHIGRKRKKKENCRNDGTALESSRKINTQLKWRRRLRYSLFFSFVLLNKTALFFFQLGNVSSFSAACQRLSRNAFHVTQTRVAGGYLEWTKWMLGKTEISAHLMLFSLDICLRDCCEFSFETRKPSQRCGCWYYMRHKSSWKETFSFFKKLFILVVSRSSKSRGHAQLQQTTVSSWVAICASWPCGDPTFRS